MKQHLKKKPVVFIDKGFINLEVTCKTKEEKKTRLILKKRRKEKTIKIKMQPYKIFFNSLIN